MANDGGSAVLPIHQSQAQETTRAMKKGSSKEQLRQGVMRTAHNMSSSSLRKKSDMTLVSKIRCGILRNFLANIHEIFMGTKLAVLFPAIPLAIAARHYQFASGWLFALSLLGLTPLAERVSFLTEQIAFYTGPTVGGLLNATCGNATELIIAMLALSRGKIEVVKCSLFGSVLSNLLLVLGTSLLFGSIANLSRHREQKYERKQADASMGLLLLGALCHLLPLMLRTAISTTTTTTTTNPAAHDLINISRITLQLSRSCSVIMLLLYAAYIFFQLKTHRTLFEADQEIIDDDDDVVSTDQPVMGFVGAFLWLIAMTAVIALLSEYVVATIEEASSTWGLSVSFISIILLPIVGNAAEHAGAVIFAFKNKLDISLGVALGSAAQISVFVFPLTVVVAWILGVPMDLDLKLIETGSLMLAVLLTAFTLQDGTSHYLKGLILLLAYVVIGVCFFVVHTPLSGASDNQNGTVNLGIHRLFAEGGATS